MKLPQNINKVYRQDRTDSLAASGISPSWWGGDAARWVGRNVWSRKDCLVKCAGAPGGKWGKAKCVADCV